MDHIVSSPGTCGKIGNANSIRFPGGRTARSYFLHVNCVLRVSFIRPHDKSAAFSIGNNPRTFLIIDRITYAETAFAPFLHSISIQPLHINIVVPIIAVLHPHNDATACAVFRYFAAPSVICSDLDRRVPANCSTGADSLHKSLVSRPDEISAVVSARSGERAISVFVLRRQPDAVRLPGDDAGGGYSLSPNLIIIVIPDEVSAARTVGAYPRSKGFCRIITD